MTINVDLVANAGGGSSFLFFACDPCQSHLDLSMRRISGSQSKYNNSSSHTSFFDWKQIGTPSFDSHNGLLIMKVSSSLLRYLRGAAYPHEISHPIRHTSRPWLCGRRPGTLVKRRAASNPADKDDFVSIVDLPPQLVKMKQRNRGPGLILLGQSLQYSLLS